MGKPQKLLSQSSKNYTLEEKERKQQAEESLNNLTPLDENPPEWLSDLAQEEYRRIYPLLQELPVASLDLGLVTAYCQAYSDYIEATTALQGEPSVISNKNGSRLNPLHTIKRDSFSIMNSITPKLGMSIDSRLKIFTPKDDKKEDDDPMARFKR